MRFARKLKLKRKGKNKTRCCGQQMTYKDGYGYVCDYDTDTDSCRFNYPEFSIFDGL